MSNDAKIWCQDRANCPGHRPGTAICSDCPDCGHGIIHHRGPSEHHECLLCSCGHGADTNTYRRRWCEVNGTKLVGVPGYEVEEPPADLAAVMAGVPVAYRDQVHNLATALLRAYNDASAMERADEYLASIVGTLNERRDKR